MRPAACSLLALGLVLAWLPPGHAAEPSVLSPLAEPSELLTPALDFPMADLQGRIHPLNQNDAQRVRVFVFLSVTCPIANGYLPTLTRLAETHRAAPVELFGVVVDPGVSRQDAAEHFAEYQGPFPILFDASRTLAAELKPTHVPEAFVVDAGGRLVYRGAIDNAWLALGRRRPRAEEHYLADAIDAALKLESSPVSRTAPVGCLIESTPAGVGTALVTYTRDIAPVVQRRCLNCHRAGQVAPFALETYEQTAGHAGQIVEVTKQRLMPPWIPSPGHARFVGERWLTEHELELFRVWEATGRTRGAAADLPPPPEFAEGWRLGTPDLIVTMPEPFTVPADGPDLLQNFVIPLELSEDRLVAAVEFHPGNKQVAHHAVLFLDDSGAARRLDRATPEPGYANFGGPGFFPSGALGGWSVGNTARRLPNDMGRYVKRGSDLVVQMHYHPTGKPEVDQSTIGIYFVDRPVAESLAAPAKLVGSIWLANYEMDIPAGDAAYERRTSYTLPREVIMVGVVPHMHLLGKTMRVTATLPDGTEQCLIDIPRWNYNWQDEYYYERPFKLPAGTTLQVAASFDNSAANPANPSLPPRRVTWGDGTTDEMLFCFFLLTAERPADLMTVIFDNLRHDARQPRKPVQP